MDCTPSSITHSLGNCFLKTKYRLWVTSVLGKFNLIALVHLYRLLKYFNSTLAILYVLCLLTWWQPHISRVYEYKLSVHSFNIYLRSASYSLDTVLGARTYREHIWQTVASGTAEVCPGYVGSEGRACLLLSAAVGRFPGSGAMAQASIHCPLLSEHTTGLYFPVSMILTASTLMTTSFFVGRWRDEAHRDRYIPSVF